MVIHKEVVSYHQIPQLAKTDLAYATGDPQLQAFYQWLPAASSFPEIAAVRREFPVDRDTLVRVLLSQYANLPVHPAVQDNIAALARPDSFTVVTAHQPALFLGPLYFIYKAMSAIKLAAIAAKETGAPVVPVFVFGSEDHDLEELNHATLFGKRIVWQPGTRGAVGEMATVALGEPLRELRGVLGGSEAAAHLYQRVEKCYREQENFANATRALIHEFLGRFGIVVLDPNHPDLKRNFSDILRAELFDQPSFSLVKNTQEQLATLGFKAQATPREINLFYLAPGLRERFVKENGIFKVLNTDLSFTAAQVEMLLQEHPERFSPNVVLRPLYQERILPNLAYVGGGGELAYWLERKPVFDHFKLPFPMLVRRNSVLWLHQEAGRKSRNFQCDTAALFEDADTLVRRFIAENATAEISLQAEMSEMAEIFEKMAKKSGAIDATLESSARAAAVRQLRVVEKLQQKLIRAEKRKHEVTVNQIQDFKTRYFPANGLQERSDNFLPFLLHYGESFLDALFHHLDPLDQGFTVLTELE